jgi:hypothetical protein
MALDIWAYKRALTMVVVALCGVIVASIREDCLWW